jgi:hypothetical protein
VNAIRRLEQIIIPAFVRLVNDADILVGGREILGCLEKIEGLTCEMDQVIGELSNEVYEQLAGCSLSRALQIFNLELAEVSCQRSLTTTGKLESNSRLARMDYEHRPARLIS